MDVTKLIQKKRRARTKGDLKMIAEVSKDLGDYYFQTGKYPEALDEYKDQVQTCEVLNDPLNVAVGNRMIGEVLTSMDRFEEALTYQNLYLEGAIQTSDLIEQQRAYATLGRTQFCLSQFLEDRDKKREALNSAKKAYVTSLLTCDKIDESEVKIERKEVMTMRARLLLNLGLVLEAKKQPAKGIQLIEKAARLCEQNNLHEDLHRSNISLGALHERLKNYNSAQEFYQKAGHTDDITLKETARLTEAELLVKWGKWSEARKILVQLYVHHNNSPSIQSVSKLLKIVAVIQSSEEKLKTEDNNRRRLKIYEDMGDAASAGNAFEKAVDYYRDMLACAEIGDIEEKIAAALVSLAQTLKDVEKYDEAIIYARRELELCRDPKEICRSSLYLGELLILACCEDSQVQEAFDTALNNAEKSGNLSLKLSVLKSMLDYSESKEDDEICSDLKKQIAELKKQIPDDESSDEEDLESSLNDIKIEIDDLSDVEEEMQKKGEKIVRKNRPRKPEFKRNLKGEMPLQVACIEGNVKRVQELLDQGHPVNCRDYCGWTPLHEAANYGFIEIAELLIKYGADINDPGGPKCGGITPLHDAAVCGHTVVINFLIEHGADPRLKTAKGETVLDCLEGWREKIEVLSPEDEAEYHIIRNKLKLIIPGTPKQSPRVNNLKSSSLQPLIDPDGDPDDPPMIPPDLPEEKRISAGEVYRRTIESLKSNRSRIMTSNSPKRNVAPLIDSEEALIDGETWLEEDMETPAPRKRRSTSSNETPGSVKRKSNNLTPNDDKNHKRRRNNEVDDVEVVVDSENSRDSFQSENSDIFTVNPSNSGRNKRRKPKQGSLLASGFSRTLDSRTPSPVFHHLDTMGSQLRTQRVEIQSRQSDLIKIEVELEDSIIRTKLRIQEDSEHLISNLINEVVDKFEEITGCRGKIELISSGDVLRADNIVNIIYKNEGVLKLAGRVLELQVPSIVERFEKICRAMKIEINDPEVLRSLKSCKNTGTFRLKRDDGLDMELMPILKSLEYEKGLQVLHLSSGTLYGLGERVNGTLVKLTSLQELHLQGCDIDYQFLGFIDHLPTQLRVLDLSYNPLGPESQEKLGELIGSLRQLQTLNLRSCRLEKFPVTIVSSSLVNLDISGNSIEGESVECFLQREIVNLSISNTQNPRNSILEVMMRGTNSIFMSLESLELTGCNLRNSDVLDLLEKCQNLTKFVLGDNPEVSQISLEALVGRKPTLMLINVTGCQKIERIPSFGLRIYNPSVCTLMASLSADVCDSWRDLWGHQALLYKQPHDIVIIRPIT